MLLSFEKTAVHPFSPRRQQGRTGFDIFTPHHLRILPRQKVVVDFLLAVQMPPDHRGQLRLKPPAADQLIFHAQELSECDGGGGGGGSV